MFACHNPIGIKYLTRTRLELSHLRYHKFKHGFLDVIDLLCSCSTGIENTVHYFLHCPNFSFARHTFLNEIAIIDRSIIDQDDIKIIQTFLYGDPTYSVNDNKLILDASIKVYFGNRKIWGTNFLGKIVMVNAMLSKWNSLFFLLLLSFFIITLLSFFTFLFSFSIFILVICFSSFYSSIVFL